MLLVFLKTKIVLYFKEILRIFILQYRISNNYKKVQIYCLKISKLKIKFVLCVCKNINIYKQANKRADSRCFRVCV